MRRIGIKQVLFILAGALLMGVCYQIELTPFPADYRTPVPLGAGIGILIAFLYPGRIGWWTIMTFFLLGIAGLPVFPQSQSGLETLKGIHGAYVWGLIPMTWVVADLVRRGWNKQFWQILVSMFIATMILFVVAFAVIYLIFGLDRAFTWTVLVQIPVFFILGLGCTAFAFAVRKWQLSKH